MGPDFLFFSVKEYGQPLQDLVNFIFGVYVQRDRTLVARAHATHMRRSRPIASRPLSRPAAQG
jgi:hypothetical protein